MWGEFKRKKWEYKEKRSEEGRREGGGQIKRNAEMGSGIIRREVRRILRKEE